MAPWPGSATVWLWSSSSSLSSLSPSGPEAPVKASAGLPALSAAPHPVLGNVRTLDTCPATCGKPERPPLLCHGTHSAALARRGLAGAAGGGLRAWVPGGLCDSCFPWPLLPSPRLSPAGRMWGFASLSTASPFHISSLQAGFPLLAPCSQCLLPGAPCSLLRRTKPSKAWLLGKGVIQEPGLVRPKHTCMLYPNIIPASVS